MTCRCRGERSERDTGGYRTTVNKLHDEWSSKVGPGFNLRRYKAGCRNGILRAEEAGLTRERTPEARDRARPGRDWDARSYHKLSEPQFEWGKRVLSSLALVGNETVMDAGCGTGRLTALLAERLPDGAIVAVDRSESMTRVAAETLEPH